MFKVILKRLMTNICSLEAPTSFHAFRFWFTSSGLVGRNPGLCMIEHIGRVINIIASM